MWELKNRRLEGDPWQKGQRREGSSCKTISYLLLKALQGKVATLPISGAQLTASQVRDASFVFTLQQPLQMRASALEVGGSLGIIWGNSVLYKWTAWCLERRRLA